MSSKGKILDDSRHAQSQLRPVWAPNKLFHFQSKLESGGLHRILKAVDATAKRRRNYSQQLDDGQRTWLSIEICGAYHQFLMLSELDHQPSTREKTKLLQEAIETARFLKQKLVGPDGSGREQYSFAARQIAAMFIPEDGFKAFLAALDQVISCGEVQSRHLGYRSQRNLKKTFVSEILPKTYEAYFGRKHGFARDKSGGPYVRFAVAVMRSTSCCRRNRKNGSPAAGSTYSASRIIAWKAGSNSVSLLTLNIAISCPPSRAALSIS